MWRHGPLGSVRAARPTSLAPVRVARPDARALPRAGGRRAQPPTRTPIPCTGTVASGAFGWLVARLKRPRAGYWPLANTEARESADPAPFASNTPVKQTPLAWLRRWPSGAPGGGPNAWTILPGVR